MTDMTDVGPVPVPPNWCLPDTEPNTETTGAGHLWFWERVVSPDVVICEDKIIDGRVMRSLPQISYSEVDPGASGVSVECAHQLGADLIAAADILTTSAIEVS